MPGNSIASSGM